MKVVPAFPSRSIVHDEMHTPNEKWGRLSTSALETDNAEAKNTNPMRENATYDSRFDEAHVYGM